MAKVVYCWELGGGLGHINSFLPIALHLKEKGHEVAFIINNLLNTGGMLGQHGFKVFQTPHWHLKAKNLNPPVNYAEILFRIGYLSQEPLYDMVMGWENILQVTAPDLAIFDHAPTAILGSRSITMKRAVFGTGFCSPPRISPMPDFRPWLKIPPQRLLNSENIALQSINGVLGRKGAPALDKLMNLFDCDENFLATFQELDHYQGRGQVRYWGAAMSMAEGSMPEWPGNGKGKRIFAYLRGGIKGVEAVLQELQETEADVLVYGPDIVPDAIKKFQTERLVFSPKMLNLSEVCRECDLVVCHAGHATVARALLAGVPVMMLPAHVEQIIMSINVVRFGAGTLVNNNDKQPDYHGAIQSALNDESIRQKAREFAARHADFDQQKQIGAIVSRMEELVAQGPEAAGP